MQYARHGLASFIALYVLLCCCQSGRTAELDADRVFDSSRLHEIELTIPEDDWNTLRKQTRMRGGGFGAMFANTTDKPFTYFRGELSIDGVKISDVAVRKKGFIGSLDDVRPSLKVTFDKYEDQHPIEGLDRLTLNNNKQDTALVSQFLSYKIFSNAGVHAPRVSFAKVTVNGQYLGIYSNVESYDAPFLRNHYGDDSGQLYEGTIADFYPKAIERLESKTDTLPEDDPQLVRLATILASEEELPIEDLETLIDVENFLKFWAVESLLGFWDGYTQNQNNYFCYDHPQNQRLYFMPWGADGCFTADGGPFGRFGGGPPPASVRAESMLANRLFRTSGIPERYRQTLLQVLDATWNEDQLVAEVDRIEALTDGQLHEQQRSDTNTAPWGGRQLTMDGVRKFIRERRNTVIRELRDWPPSIPPQPRKPMYTVDLGFAKGSFLTHWSEQTSAAADEQGEVTIELNLHERDIVLTDPTIASHSMPVPTFPGFGGPRGNTSWTPPAMIVIKGKQDSNQDQQEVTLTLMVEEQLLAMPPNEPVPASGSIVIGNAAGFGFRPDGPMVNGTIVLVRSGTNDGDEVRGTFDLQISELHGGMFDQRRRR